MCRADVAPAARTGLASILDDMAHALADRYGADRDNVTLGPVDFGEPEVTP